MASSSKPDVYQIIGGMLQNSLGQQEYLQYTNKLRTMLASWMTAKPSSSNQKMELEVRFGNYLGGGHGRDYPQFRSGIPSRTFYTVVDWFERESGRGRYTKVTKLESMNVVTIGCPSRSTTVTSRDHLTGRDIRLETYQLPSSSTTSSVKTFTVRSTKTKSNESFPIENPEYGFRVATSMESPLEAVNTATEYLNIEPGSSIREKTRWSYVASQTGRDVLQPFRIDLTKVVSSQSGSTTNSRPMTTYEVELELIQPQLTVGDFLLGTFFMLSILQSCPSIGEVISKREQFSVIRDYNAHFRREIEDLDRKTTQQSNKRSTNWQWNVYSQFVKPVNVPREVLADPKQATRLVVTDKAHGDRCFLISLPLLPDRRALMVYSIKPATNMISKIGSFQNNHQQQRYPSIVDCELVENLRSPGSSIILAFDILFENGKDLRGLALRERVERLNAFASQTKLPINVKRYQFQGETVFERAKAIWSNLPTVYANDGLIMNFVDGSYDSPVYKWKPANQMTIDFALLTIDGGSDGRQPKRFSLNVIGEGGGLVQFNGESIDVDSSTTGTTTNNAGIENGQVAECLYDFATKRFKIVRMRLDRQHPNSSLVANAVWADIVSPISPDEITGVSSLASSTQPRFSSSMKTTNIHGPHTIELELPSNVKRQRTSLISSSVPPVGSNPFYGMAPSKKLWSHIEADLYRTLVGGYQERPKILDFGGHVDFESSSIPPNWRSIHAAVLTLDLNNQQLSPLRTELDELASNGETYLKLSSSSGSGSGSNDGGIQTGGIQTWVSMEDRQTVVTVADMTTVDEHASTTNHSIVPKFLNMLDDLATTYDSSKASSSIVKSTMAFDFATLLPGSLGFSMESIIDIITHNLRVKGVVLMFGLDMNSEGVSTTTTSTTTTVGTMMQVTTNPSQRNNGDASTPSVTIKFVGSQFPRSFTERVYDIDALTDELKKHSIELVRKYSILEYAQTNPQYKPTSPELEWLYRHHFVGIFQRMSDRDTEGSEDDAAVANLGDSIVVFSDESTKFRSHFANTQPTVSIKNMVWQRDLKTVTSSILERFITTDRPLSKFIDVGLALYDASPDTTQLAVPWDLPKNIPVNVATMKKIRRDIPRAKFAELLAEPMNWTSFGLDEIIPGLVDVNVVIVYSGPHMNDEPVVKYLRTTDANDNNVMVLFNEQGDYTRLSIEMASGEILQDFTVNNTFINDLITMVK